MMSLGRSVTNLRDYVSQNAPTVTFFLCLWTLSISFFYLSSYGHTHSLPNPDITKDWNQLLSSLSKLQLCVKIGEDSSEHVSTTTSPPEDKEKETDPSAGPTEAAVTYLHLKVPLVVTSSSASLSQKDLGLHTTLKAKQLNIGDNEAVNLTLEFVYGESMDTCLTISAPTHILPMTILPPECDAYEKNVSFLYVEASNQLPTSAQTCFSMQSRNDPSLTVMLTKEEQSVAVQHLLEASVCLLGVCLILCLTAGLMHSSVRSSQWNGLDHQHVKKPLIEN
ncbi:transmembrane protein 248 [Betta splendens]|uniref:Transmembrane protein 248 n=1 Tax=Betta splendens TaxID=158456 RepID=A0A6P7NQU7_BETSP|nr:transmembrane protein 248 [Betta splendens]